ncbi:MAG: SMP-30/gluconolactonase/LRE family protein [Thermoanaerobaculia bacterium]|nr:SMP-30/gluconolactonase/LRE family protein [Thermoanaerobaculia bacterium]
MAGATRRRAPALSNTQRPADLPADLDFIDMGHSVKRTDPFHRTSRLPVTLILSAVAVGTFLLWPSSIDPAAWTPPAAPALAGPTAPNQALERAERMAQGDIVGPEDLAVDASGRIWGGLVDGRIVRFLPDGDIETVYDTGGRPLGLHFDAEGRLLIADASAGLLRLYEGPDAATRVETLTTEADGVPFRFTDDLDIASDGKIYFSDASHRWDHHHYLHDLLEAKPHGRLLVYDPADGTTRVLLEDLYFANGIALSQNEDFVLVNETYRYRITRYWLDGPEAGTSDVFIDNLPCIPDGVSANRRGTFWVACFTVRNERADKLQPRPFMKKQLVKLPRALWPQPEPHGVVLQLDESAAIIASFHDPGGEVIPEVTSVEEHNGWLYLGNLKREFAARFRLPAQSPAASDSDSPDSPSSEPDSSDSVP